MKKTLFSLLSVIALLAGMGCAVRQPSAAPEPTAVEITAQPIPSASMINATETAPQAALPPSYAAVIAEYADAVQNGYYADIDSDARDAAFGKSVALEWKANPQPVYYALSDLDGNGLNELIIGAGTDAATLSNYDIFCDAGNAAVRPFDMDFGYRANFDVYASGVIEVCWSDSAFESGSDFYRINGVTAEQIDSLFVTSDPERADGMLYWQGGAERSAEEFNLALDAYESMEKRAFDWKPIPATN